MTLDAAAAPASDVDLYSDAALLDPYPAYQRLREAGPAVWLRTYGMYAISRYEDVRRALLNAEVFSSAHGVMMNERINETLRGIMLCTDAPEHRLLRDVARRPLAHHELRNVEAELEAEAVALVDRLVRQGTFEAVGDLAQHLPMAVVSRLVGLPEEGRERMLEWAAANFNCFGPLNERAMQSFPVLDQAVRYSTDPTLRSRLKPGGWAARLFDAADGGEIPHERAAVMLNDYWGPSLDTTIHGITSAIWLFARHPQQWDLVRASPSLLPHAVNEVMRLESPIQGFSRFVTQDTTIDGVAVPAGSRVILLFGSANRDERKWEDPERFDVTRRPSDHLAFGYGEHQCMGMPLARLEMRVLLEALARRVRQFELGRSDRALNNVLRGFARLDVTVRE